MSDVSRTRLITGEKLTKGTAQQQRTARIKLTRTKTAWCFLFLAKTKKERNPKTHHPSMCQLVSPIRCGMRHTLVALPSERAPLREPRASSRRHAKNGAAAPAHHHRLAVREHRGDLEATLTLDVHEEAVRALYKSLQLVLLLLHVRRRVQQVEVSGENLKMSKEPKDESHAKREKSQKEGRAREKIWRGA